MAALSPGIRLVCHERRSKLRAALFGHIGLLESYFDGDIDVEGDLRAAIARAFAAGLDPPPRLVDLRNRLHEWRFSNASWDRAKRNARSHYGLGTDFFRLWLDEALMMYTCAYWKEDTRTLEEAQIDKVEHICRKLMIGRDDAVVDIGCGFGGFMFQAERRYGARVTGINTTTEQVAMVRAQIERRGLGDRLRVVETDFRDAFQQYDKLASIGVLEHAGRDQVREVIRAHARFLKPGGLGLLHFIGHVGEAPTEFFIRRYVFPGGWIPDLAQVLVAMEDAGLEVLDVENLRRHYALTLDAWAERFDRNWERIHLLEPRSFDERFRRIWRTYLYGCAELFRARNGRTHLFQVLFSKGNATSRTYPRTRDHLYGTAEQVEAELAIRRARAVEARAS